MEFPMSTALTTDLRLRLGDDQVADRPLDLARMAHDASHYLLQPRVVVTARDEHGNEASQKFRFRVGDAKLAGKPALEAQLRTEGSHARSAERLALLRAARAQS